MQLRFLIVSAACAAALTSCSDPFTGARFHRRDVIVRDGTAKVGVIEYVPRQDRDAKVVALMLENVDARLTCTLAPTKATAARGVTCIATHQPGAHDFVFAPDVCVVPRGKRALWSVECVDPTGQLDGQPVTPDGTAVTVAAATEAGPR